MAQQLSLRGGIVLGLLVLGFFSIAYAQAPAQAPLKPSPLFLNREGRIENIDRTEGMIVIQDSLYYLSPDLRVYVYDRTIKDLQALRADTRLKDAQALRVGMHIGYIVEGEAGGKRGTLTEAWILPAGSLPHLGKGVKSGGQPETKATGKAQPGR